MCSGLFRQRLGHQDLKDRLAIRAKLDLRGHPAIKALKDLQDPQVGKDHQAVKDLKDLQDPQAILKEETIGLIEGGGGCAPKRRLASGEEAVGRAEL